MNAPIPPTKEIEVHLDSFTALFGGSILVSTPWLPQGSIVVAVPRLTDGEFTSHHAGRGELGPLGVRGDLLITFRRF